MKPTFNDKLMAWMVLASGIAISCVAEFYSIMGLIAIYPAALIPIVVMGITIGIGKLIATVWVKQNWNHAPLLLKTYILPAIAILMLITSVGVFGFLSKAHSDQSLVSGDAQAKIAVYDEKIKTERENIDAYRKSLKQMDEVVDQVMARSTSEEGASRSSSLRKSQQKERSRLAQDITASQQKITALNEERAPIAAEIRKVEAEVGPIKYIAAFVYGDNPDANVLEKAVSWISILIVIVLDPLAIVLLLASQYSFQRFKNEEEDVEKFWQRAHTVAHDLDNNTYTAPHETGTENPIDFPKYEPDDGPLTQEQIDAIKEDAEKNKPTGNIISSTTLFTDRDKIDTITEEEMTQLKQSLDEFARVYNENKQQDQVSEPAPIPVRTLESSNIRRTKVFPKITPPGFQQVPDYIDGDYVIIKGQRYHKRAMPAGYIQNEEQNESNLWSNTVSNSPPQSISPQEYIDAVKKSSE
jgi:hypothetical protein